MLHTELFRLTNEKVLNGPKSASLVTVCFFLLKLFPFFHNDRWMFTYCLPTTGFTLLIQTLEALRNLDL